MKKPPLLLYLWISCALVWIKGCNGSIPKSFNETKHQHPRIIIIGSGGVGKSTMANVLLGQDKDYQGFFKKHQEACFNPDQRWTSDVLTRTTCAEPGYFLGDQLRPFTAIDTPGFNDHKNEEKERIDKFVDDLKNVKFLDTFVLLFNGQQPKFSTGLESMLRWFEAMFGNVFWKNVILGFSRWEHSEEKKNEREETFSDQQDAEDKHLSEWSKKIKDKFEVPGETEFQAVFIDTHYNEKDPTEKKAFKENTEKLWTFAQETKAHPFECKDIKAALTEIKALEEKNANLTRDMKAVEAVVEELRGSTWGNNILSSLGIDTSGWSKWVNALQIVVGAVLLVICLCVCRRVVNCLCPGGLCPGGLCGDFSSSRPKSWRGRLSRVPSWRPPPSWRGHSSRGPEQVHYNTKEPESVHYYSTRGPSSV